MKTLAMLVTALALIVPGARVLAEERPQASPAAPTEAVSARAPDAAPSGVLIGAWERFLRTGDSPPQTLVISELKGGELTGTFKTRRGDVTLNPENSKVLSERGKIKVELRFAGMANYDLYYEGGELNGKERVLFGQLKNREFDVVFQKNP